MVSAQYSAVTPDFMTLKLSLEMKWKLQVVPTSAVPIMCLLFNIWVQFHTAFMIPCVSGFNLFQTFYSPLKYFGYFIPLTAPEFHHGCCGEMAMPQDEEAVKSTPSLQEQKIPACSNFSARGREEPLKWKYQTQVSGKLWADHSNWWWVQVRNHISRSQ